jgi:hypothetical protein
VLVNRPRARRDLDDAASIRAANPRGIAQRRRKAAAGAAEAPSTNRACRRTVEHRQQANAAKLVEPGSCSGLRRGFVGPQSGDRDDACAGQKAAPKALVGKTCDARSQLGNRGSIAVVSAPAMGVLADLIEERNLILKLLGRAS